MIQQARLRSARQESWVQERVGWLPVYTCQRRTVATCRFVSPSYHNSSEPASLMTTATIKWPISCYFIRNTVQSPVYNVRCNQISHKKKDKQLAGWCTNIVVTSFKMKNRPQASLGRLRSRITCLRSPNSLAPRQRHLQLSLQSGLIIIP